MADSEKSFAIDELLRVQRMFWNALRDKDRAVLEDLVSNAFVGRSPNESNQTRREFIDTLTGFSAKVLTIDGKSVEVNIIGAVGVVSGIQTAEIELPNKQTVTEQIAITNIYELDADGKWRLSFAHPVTLRQ